MSIVRHNSNYYKLIILFIIPSILNCYEDVYYGEDEYKYINEIKMMESGNDNVRLLAIKSISQKYVDGDFNNYQASISLVNAINDSYREIRYFACETVPGKIEKSMFWSAKTMNNLNCLLLSGNSDDREVALKACIFLKSKSYICISGYIAALSDNSREVRILAVNMLSMHKNVLNQGRINELKSLEMKEKDNEIKVMINKILSK